MIAFALAILLTPLVEATLNQAQTCFFQSVLLLLKNGADPSLKNTKLETPLHLAARWELSSSLTLTYTLHYSFIQFVI